MTREEILSLPAGRELDVLVAEKVMGWRCTIGETSHKGRVIAWPFPDRSGIEFEPSTDIAAAWLVVEHIRGWKPLCRRDPCDYFAIDSPQVGNDYPDPPGAWCVGWHDYAGGERISSVEAKADTAPLAICRAALLAVETS